MNKTSSSLLNEFPFFSSPETPPSNYLPPRTSPTFIRTVAAYRQYSIPLRIRPSVFPYFLNSPLKPAQSPKNPKVSSSKKPVLKRKFILKLPNKAFKIKNGSLIPSKSQSSSVLDKLNQPLAERHFSAVTKTVPLEKFRREGEIQEAISRVFRQEESNKRDSFLRSPIPSFSPLSSHRRPQRRGSSTNRNKAKKDNFDVKGLNTSQFSMKSSLLNMDYFIPGKKPNKDKDKAFLELYLNSFDESPENNRLKSSRISKIGSPLVLAPSFLQNRENKELKSPETRGKSQTLGIKLRKVDYEKEEDHLDDNENKKDKKRTDHNFMKILLHYWKYENKVPKNRPPPPKKIIWNRKINFAHVRKSLLELLTFLGKSNITLTEVQIIYLFFFGGCGVIFNIYI